MDAGAESLRAARMRRASRTAVTLAATLAIAKLATGLIVNSMAVIASAVDSLLDLVASSVNLVAIRVALAPPDEDHRFGHSKAEALATGLQAFLIGGSSVYLLVEGARRVLEPEALRRAEIGLAVMGVSAVASGVLVLYMRRVARETRSSALRADSTHYATDVLANLAILVGVAAAWWSGVRRVDGILTIGVAVYVGFSAWGLLREATRVLMDAEIPAEDRALVEGVLREHVERGLLTGWHALRTRVAGRAVFVEVHLEMDGALTLETAHSNGDAVMARIHELLPGSQVTVHLDAEDDQARPTT